MIETRKSAGIVFTEAAAAVVLSSEAFTNVPAEFFTAAIRNLVLDRINQFDVADRARQLADHSGHAFVAFIAKPKRPFHGCSLPNCVLPFRTYLGEIVGEDKSGAATV